MSFPPPAQNDWLLRQPFQVCENGAGPQLMELAPMFTRGLRRRTRAAPLGDDIYPALARLLMLPDQDEVELLHRADAKSVVSGGFAPARGYVKQAEVEHNNSPIPVQVLPLYPLRETQIPMLRGRQRNDPFSIVANY